MLASGAACYAFLRLIAVYNAITINILCFVLIKRTSLFMWKLAPHVTFAGNRLLEK